MSGTKLTSESVSSTRSRSVFMRRSQVFASQSNGTPPPPPPSLPLSSPTHKRFPSVFLLLRGRHTECCEPITNTRGDEEGGRKWEGGGGGGGGRVSE